MKGKQGGPLWAAAWGLCLLAGPAWADTEGTQVKGLGEIIYHEGDVEAFGDGPDVLTFGVGAFDAFKTNPAAGEFRVEYRVGQKLLFIGPMVGVMATTDGGVYGYGAFYLDSQIGRLSITPSIGLGGYHRGDGKRLGGPFLFHSAVDFAYRFDNGMRLGVKVTHISNAFIYKNNPGEESVLLTYTLPIGNLFGD